MKKVIALDFDGLICNGLKECILVSWNGYDGKDVSDFSAQGLEAIPVEFCERFKHCRNFAKHLGHFAVPLFDYTTPIATQEDFEAVYQSINSDVIDEFTKNVTAYRHKVRREKEAEWLSSHTLYPGMETFLTTIDLPVYIVTAKDGDSVMKILSSAGIQFDESQIFGEQKMKIEAFRKITDLSGIPPHELHFFDDNILNVVEAQKAGYSAYWATWGYNAPDHIHIAKENSVSSITLSEFLKNHLGVLDQ
ncbi:HAD family hydrolase [Nostoc sp. 106C]|uniref:HAD family hydrolase n=1 Tax=Nostoc sp. 106C TaxID=1932667 RepID=UPI000A3D3D97|nr:HAD family hydrolase [Nostoc sp. 106C]OUL30733.1 hypothetical protein BV375_13575 [Nostoc sp. 106C]